MSDAAARSFSEFESIYRKVDHLVSVGRYDLAEREVRQRLQSDPEDLTVRYLLAYVLYKSEQLDEAEREARAVLRRDAEDGDVMLLLARIACDRGKHREAEQLLLNVLRVSPRNVEGLRVYGHLMQKTGHFEKAEQLVRASLEVAPDDRAAHSMLSLILSSKNQAAASLCEGQTGLKLAPEQDVSHWAYGISCFRSGRPFAARRHFREALRLDPSDAEVESMYLAADRACRWLYLPMYYTSLLTNRLPGGPFALWGIVVVFFVLSPRRGAWASATVWVVLIWFLFCVYSWVAAPLTRIWVRWVPPR